MSHRTILAFAALLLAVLVAASPAFAAKSGTMSTPQLSCGSSTGSSINVVVCAGTTGAPAGFSLHWMELDDYLAGGSVWPDSALICHGSFSGNASGAAYNLAPGQCTTIQLGDNLFDTPGASSNCTNEPLQCGTDYVIRGFAHATSSLNRSAFTGDLVCSTLACGGSGCTLTQGFWKTHYPDSWPQDVLDNGLMLGAVTYTAAEIESIFNTPPAGNGLIPLAHQLIAAKLNVAAGADDSSIAAAIAAADALIGGLVVPPVGNGSLANSVTSALTTTLDSYNQGLTGPGHCG